MCQPWSYTDRTSLIGKGALQESFRGAERGATWSHRSPAPTPGGLLRGLFPLLSPRPPFCLAVQRSPGTGCFCKSSEVIWKVVYVHTHCACAWRVPARGHVAMDRMGVHVWGPGMLVPVCRCGHMCACATRVCVCGGYVPVYTRVSLALSGVSKCSGFFPPIISITTPIPASVLRDLRIWQTGGAQEIPVE